MSTFPGDLVALIEKSSDEIYVLDVDSAHYLYANERARSNTGYTLEELSGMTPLDLQRDVDVFEMAVRARALQNEELGTIEFETRYYRKDGSSYDVLHHAEMIREPKRVYLIHARELDASSASRPILQMTSGEDRYREMVEAAGEGVWSIDADGRTTYANQRIADMLGYSREEMAGKSVFDFMDDEGRAIAEGNFERRRQGISQRLDFKYIRKDGSELWAIISTRPQFDERGEYAGAVAIVSDVTEQKTRERQLLASLELDSLDELLPVPGQEQRVLRMPSVTGVRATRVARRFSVLADPRRLELIELLASGEERAVGALADALGMTQSNVSKHLKILAQAGLVTRRQEGAKSFYALDDPMVAVICRLVCRWLGEQAHAEFRALAS